MRYHNGVLTPLPSLVYSLFRPLLFALDPERSHDLTLNFLRRAWSLPGVAPLTQRLYTHRLPSLALEVMGLDFLNPVGLAAGLDKDARCVAPFFDFGFGFLELGTVTPAPQPGNPKPRLFRLPDQAALINRFGFNSAGLTTFLANLAGQPRRGPIGINLGKNKSTPETEAIYDYRCGLQAVYAHADYVTINISSPNTPGLRTLQDAGPLAALLAALKQEQGLLTKMHGRYVPLVLKIAPDLNNEDLDRIAQLLLTHRFDGIVATNTTLQRPGLEHLALAHETGGLSGKPLAPLSTSVIRRLYSRLQGHIPIIGVGGIGSHEEAWQRLVDGADLIQIYTGFIYQGPVLLRRILYGLTAKVQSYGVSTLREAVNRARAANGIR